MNKKTLSNCIREAVSTAGFDACGIAAANILADEKKRLEEWLAAGYHAGMTYMERNIEKRVDPALLVENTKSVVVMLLNYKPPHAQPSTIPQAAYFAYGNDYHEFIHEKMQRIISTVKNIFPAVNLRGFVDSAPVLERAWAARAGLGWIGKNNLLITPDFGSFVLIATLFVDAELDYDSNVMESRCGSCTRCLEACPNKALRAPYLLDANRCAAYQTIENKEPAKNLTPNYFFGCDLCQHACPWNEKTQAHQQADWPAIPQLLSYTMEDWERLNEPSFNSIFAKSSLRRSGFAKLKYNLAACNCKQL